MPLYAGGANREADVLPACPEAAASQPGERRMATRGHFVVIGFTRPPGTRCAFAALLLGQPTATGVQYVGNVPVPPESVHCRRLRRRLIALEMPALAVNFPIEDSPARWVRPRLVVEVGFNGWLEDGRLCAPRLVELCDAYTLASLRACLERDAAMAGFIPQ